MPSAAAPGHGLLLAQCSSPQSATSDGSLLLLLHLVVPPHRRGGCRSLLAFHLHSLSAPHLSHSFELPASFLLDSWTSIGYRNIDSPNEPYLTRHLCTWANCTTLNKSATSSETRLCTCAVALTRPDHQLRSFDAISNPHCERRRALAFGRLIRRGNTRPCSFSSTSPPQKASSTSRPIFDGRERREWN